MAGHRECGGFVYDPVARRVGEYRGEAGPYAMLRPVGGGREWQADPERVRPATAAERLSAGVRAANERAGVEYEMSRPPEPVPGCVECAELAARRAAARARFDWSAETDANVLLRRHRTEHHPPAPVTSTSP
ncbi:hypothetical protein Q5762_26755 [Streptomyces sp. P9(2023)]|uniref:hypothetical protein n=1 Tax=Streptomyces sp. P9(2023) TaxID=3064394 RepID=UPI0028F44BDC|nr:hypothetical protein [Streptomyces sp. P9(2023)]MDT9691868.1 hypothetical protein [Streptomyces sp. P9(2023)]